MLSVWRSYWSDKYQTIKEQVGKTGHLDELKASSWREVQVFMECYDSAGNVVELGEEIDEMELYGIVIHTMFKIFDADTCYEEYCEHEFEQPDIWESIILGDDEGHNYDGPIFFIKPYEF